jgi:HK97 family phage portal protein
MITFGGMAQAIIQSLWGGALSNPEQGYHIAGPVTTRNESGVTYTDDRAMQITAVYACVKIITQTVATLPLHMYERTATGRKLVTDHPVNYLLRVSPNAMMTPLDFRMAMTAQLCLGGNSYAFKDYSGTRITSLIPARFGCMTPKREGNQVVYEYSTNTGLKRYSSEEILHLKGFGTDGLVGLSPLRYGAQAFGVTVATEQYAADTFAKGGKTSGVLEMPAILTADQRKQAKALHDDMHNEGGLFVLEGGTKYHPISIDPDDLQMLESRKFQLGEIARMFGVPSFLINDTEKSTSWGTGIEQQNLGWLAYGLRAYLIQWEAALNSSLFTPSEQEKYFVEHTVEGLLRADSQARASYYATMVSNGLMTRNEVRALENWPPVEGADELTAQVNMAPLDKLGQTAAQPKPAKGDDDAGIQDSTD